MPTGRRAKYTSERYMRARIRARKPVNILQEDEIMRSITTLDLQYAHRFYGFKGEAQYLHGHTGVLTIEVEDTVNPYPECRLVVTKETMTVEGMIKIVYDLLKDKLNIAKLTFTSGVNAASAEFETNNKIERCPLCGIALNEDGVCPKCGYKKG